MTGRKGHIYQKNRQKEINFFAKTVLCLGFFAWIWLISFFIQIKKPSPKEQCLGWQKQKNSPSWQLESNNSQRDKSTINFNQNISSVLTANLETGEIYYSENENQKLPIASLTKIMTAIIALEHSPLDQEITVPKEALDIPEDSSVMGITPGEKYTLEELLHGIILSSGNDAAQAIAWSLSGNQDRFVYWMNRKAQGLGLKNTRFANPSGLDDPQNYSTAHDLAILTHFAVEKHPILTQISRKESHIIAYTPNKHKYLWLPNHNELIKMYPGVYGLKPGNTGNAGSCLIALSQKGEEKIIVIILGSQSRNMVARQLLDDAWEKILL